MRPAFVALPGLLLAGALVAAQVNAAVPVNATAVPVTAGTTTSGIDAHLAGAASIAGTLRDSAGNPLSGKVYAYLGGRQVRVGFADDTGHFVISALRASATGYAICTANDDVSANIPFPRRTGILGRCYKNAAFDGTHVASTATKFPLVAGQHKTGIHFTIPIAAGISGRIFRPSGTFLRSATVIVRTTAGRTVASTRADDDGTYVVSGLPPTPNGYVVCARPSQNNGPTGYLPRCWKKVPWKGGSTPRGVGAVPVTAAHMHTGINITVTTGAAITGRVVDAHTGKPVDEPFGPGLRISAVSATGHVYQSARTNGAGDYKIRGLGTASGVRVCAWPVTVNTAVERVSYQGRCWRNATWHGGRPAAGAASVSTSVGQTRAGVSFTVTGPVVKLASIEGTVTEKAGGNPVANASVSIFSSAGKRLRGTSTDVAGHYAFDEVRPDSTGYAVCVKTGGFAEAYSPGTPTPDTGWAARCYHDVAWSGSRLASDSAARLPLTPGQDRTGIDIALPVGGAISGTVTTTGATPAPILNAWVYVFTIHRHLVEQTFSGSDGSYAFENLSPGAYLVCFDGRRFPESTSAFTTQCWHAVAWHRET